jgi:hypothetical protein
MQAWEGWPLERLIVLFVAAAYLLVWVQVSLLHWRGAFRHRAMWGPVIYTPIVVIVALALLVVRGDVIDMLYVIALAIACLVGLVGVWFHLRGVAAQIGGMTLRNLMGGPPPVLPLIYAAVGAFGLLARSS